MEKETLNYSPTVMFRGTPCTLIEFQGFSTGLYRILTQIS